MLGPRLDYGTVTVSAPIPPSSNGPALSKWFGFFPEFRKDVLGFLSECRRYGDVVKLPVGHWAEILLRRPGLAVYLLHHPDDIKHVLVTNQHNYVKGPIPPVEAKIFGRGLLHLEGPEHHAHRRLLLPFFHGAHIHAYADMITTKTAALAERWSAGGSVDMGQAMSRLTLSIIWPVLFGRELGPEAMLIAESIEVGHRLINKQYHSLFAQLTPLWLPTKLHRDFSRVHGRLDSFVGELIRTRRREPREDQEDVLSLLCLATDESGAPLTEQAIRDELMTLMLAGHETTANALTWTWFLLAQHPEIRAKLTAELQRLPPGRLPGVTDLQQLVYTKRVWDESLRLYPPAWALHMRLAREEDPLPSGASIPAGAYVFLSPWSVQRDSRWFPDPDRFDPERFAPGAVSQRPQFSYFPFGGGGRRCLGEAFAELEGLLILSVLAARMRFASVGGKPLSPDALMTLRPKSPVYMDIEPVLPSSTAPPEIRQEDFGSRRGSA
jgi:cytochrome P450